MSYFYLDKPTNNLPALAPVSTRVVDLDEKEPPKAALAQQLLQALYVPGSLRAKENGFAFTLQNVIETSPLVAFKRLTIDGELINPGNIVIVTMHGVEKRISGISDSAPLLFPVNTTLRVQVNGRFISPGQHTIQAQFMLQNIPEHHRSRSHRLPYLRRLNVGAWRAMPHAYQAKHSAQLKLIKVEKNGAT